ncbi:class 3 adenylate cyclase/tetratricopeptide (TPR) repeat protein [Bacillus mesophilus]|uniref:AAA family ATPase n=1 Tax=Bacillus mesophilus TaxID=1808955 RepID=A0A6M0Q6Q7_9BACI|nr:adenylate/guanylate cyclase domain-containing protein [Bacillus mesophilus]MBM7661363.1 class 3 adenylate cyclase/tetratricopeptide (TPR) repeat protein [Bacillus mesophilus]NEY72036.1 AAA family ATPase [Bacillus mesophilus]
MLSHTSESLTSYLSNYIIRKVQNDRIIEGPKEDFYKGAILFADLSKFTSLTEQLMKKGSIGLEELSTVLNGYFNKIISLVTEHGGEVVSFAGDALIAVWNSEDDEQLSLSTKYAVICGAAMQEYISSTQTTENIQLSMRVLISAGSYKVSFVGGIKGKWEVVLSGEAVVQLHTLENAYELKKVLLSPQTYKLLAINEDNLEDLNLLTTSIITTPTLEIPEEQQTLYEPYLPPSVLSTISENQTDWSAEYRFVTVMFVHLPDYYKGDASLDVVHKVIRSIQDILNFYNGSLHKMSIDEKGVSVISAMGLPSLTHEDDGLRLIKAAISISTNLKEMDVNHSIGIASGLVFCGTIGNRIKREYTMIGDVVNLAARLMSIGKMSIFCDDATFQLTQNEFHFGKPEHILLKGLSSHIPVYSPIGLKGKNTSTYNQAFVGRLIEEEVLKNRLARYEYGESSIVFMQGEAGIGKTQLLQRLIEEAKTFNYNVLTGSGDSIERLTPYYAWRPIFHEILNVHTLPEDALLRQKEIQQKIERELPHVKHLCPLLNVVLSLDLPDNEWTRPMTGRVRADNTHQLFIEVLRYYIGTTPTVIMLDDAHWVDSASWSFLLSYLNHCSPSFIVMSMRPEFSNLPPEYSVIESKEDSIKIKLDVLTFGETNQLISQCLGIQNLPSKISSFIYAKTEGHPFFSEELAYALRDGGMITITGDVCEINMEKWDLVQVQFPNSIQGVITSRIDRLSYSEQLGLKTASVIGRSFTYSALEGIYPIVKETDRLSDYLYAYEQLNLTMLEEVNPELTYMFKHILTQEVTYHMLVHSQRKQLHLALAEWYEEKFSSDLSPYYSVLAYHWDQAEVPLKTLEYLELAGNQSMETGAYPDAVKLFSELIEKAEGKVDLYSRNKQGVWHRLLGESYMGIGDMIKAEASLKKALTLLGNGVKDSRILYKLSMLQQVSIQILHRAIPNYFITSTKVVEDILEQARCYFRLSEIYFFTNKPMDNLYCSLRGLNLAEKSGPSLELAQITGNMCVTAGILTFYPLARTYRNQALKVVEQVDDLRAKAWASMDISLYHIGVGEWEDSLKHSILAMGIYEKIGDRRYWEACSYLYVKALAFHLADYEKSSLLANEIYQSGKKSGNAQAQSWGLLGQAECYIYQEQYQDAIELLTEAEDLIKINIGLIEEIRVYSQLAVSYLKLNQLELSFQFAEKALTLIMLSAPTAYYAYDSYAAVVEVYLNRVQHQPEMTEKFEQALGELKKFAKIFPIAWSRYYFYKAKYSINNDLEKQALKYRRESLKWAEKLDMPYEKKINGKGL